MSGSITQADIRITSYNVCYTKLLRTRDSGCAGNFDGVHLGHRALLEEAARLAHEEGTLFSVIVFEPYPLEYFRPDAEPFRLTPFRAKARLLEEIGTDSYNFV